MSREVRKVAVDWQHPKLNAKLFVPLLDGARFQKDVKVYEEDKRMWRLGQVRDPVDRSSWISRGEAGVSETVFEAYAGPAPDVRDYMPQWRPEEAAHYVLYETITRGTPLTPAFATTDELAAWCVEHDITLCPTRKLTFAGWLKLCHGFTMGQLLRDKADTLFIEPALA